MRIYRRLTYGNLAEFNVLDTRQYRDDQPNGDEFNSAPSEESRDPNRTITGDAQERWLLEGLAASDARWNVLAQQVFFSQVDFDFDEGVGINPDAWDGYAAQRDRFVDHFRSAGCPTRSCSPAMCTPTGRARSSTTSTTRTHRWWAPSSWPPR
jgi:alkaline phosphatase D